MYEPDAWMIRNKENNYILVAKKCCRVARRSEVTNKEFLQKRNENRKTLVATIKKKANWVGHKFRRNCL